MQRFYLLRELATFMRMKPYQVSDLVQFQGHHVIFTHGRYRLNNESVEEIIRFVNNHQRSRHKYESRSFFECNSPLLT